MLADSLFLSPVTPLQTTCLIGASSPAPTVHREWTLDSSIRLITVVGSLIVAVILCGILLMYLRRRMRDHSSPLDSPGAMMEELRRLRKDGIMSESEYEASRRAAAAKLTTRPDAAGSQSPSAAPGVAASARPITPSPPNRTIPKPTPSNTPDRSPRTARPGFDLTGEPLPKPPPSSPDTPS